MIGNWGATDERVPDAATENAIYGNHIRGSGELAIGITDEVSAADQRYLCGNDVQERAVAGAEQACPADVPAGSGVGHTGGDSPWT